MNLITLPKCEALGIHFLSWEQWIAFGGAGQNLIDIHFSDEKGAGQFVPATMPLGAVRAEEQNLCWGIHRLVTHQTRPPWSRVPTADAGTMF